jgi:NodT family efflux transporter outer membrane factor (OMF) lipoprotein
MDRQWKCGMVGGALAVLAGCATGPDFRTPAAPVSGTYGVEPAGVRAGAEVPEAWWELFGCGALNAAVEEALAKSPAQAQALARLKQAQAEYRAQTGATAWPAVDAGLSAQRQKVNPEAMGMTGAPVPDPFEVYHASVSVSYMLDWAGKNRRLREGAAARVEQRRWEERGARETLAANVALAFIRRAEVQERLAAARDVVEARVAQAAMAAAREQVGGISRAEVERQGLLLEQAKALVPPLEKLEAQLGRQLAVYLGREPGEGAPEGIRLSELHLAEELPLRLPSELARRRPDIRAAEALWHQACANVGVAAADLYPQIVLTASLGSQETDVADLLESANVWSLGAGLAQPVFRGGALRAKKRAAEAALDEAAAAYRQVVLHGLQEVADVLGALAADAAAGAARSAAAAHAREGWSIASGQREAGGISEGAWLEERIRLRQAEAEEQQAQAARLADAAALMHALGGGWESANKNPR